MSDFQIVEIKQGSVTTNFDVIREELSNQLDIYRNIEVTEDSLPVCKDVKKNLKGQSKDIDTFRKQVKKELTAPIKDFEDKCKELQDLIEEVVSPIDEGIREFDEKTRKEKIEAAKQLIDEVAAKMDFADIEKIEIKDSWGNVSTTQKTIKEDITSQIQSIKEQQRDRERRIETFKTLIGIENEKLDSKMSVEDFIDLVDEGKDDSEIITEIKKASDLIYKAEKGQKDRQVGKDEKDPSTPQIMPDTSNKAGYLIRVYDERSTADEILEILMDNGFFAKVEN